jgi:glycosyltransferase involved in cell wall biosynthesis
MQALRLKLDVWRVRQADISIPMSEWAARILVERCRVPHQSVNAIHVGLDLEYWLVPKPAPVNPNAKRKLLFVGGDFERKGGALVLEVHQQHFSHEVQLHIVTRAPPAGSFKNVVFYNDIVEDSPRLRQLYLECDVFVLPTTSDISPWVCLEAMACCRPVISTKVGGIPDIVLSGESGLLIEKGDRSALKRSIEVLLGDPGLRLKMGMRGRTIVENKFSAGVNVPRIIQLMKAGVAAREA